MLSDLKWSLPIHSGKSHVRAATVKQLQTLQTAYHTQSSTHRERGRRDQTGTLLTVASSLVSQGAALLIRRIDIGAIVEEQLEAFEVP
jgi:hypothetical protein